MPDAQTFVACLLAAEEFDLGQGYIEGSGDEASQRLIGLALDRRRLEPESVVVAAGIWRHEGIPGRARLDPHP